MNDNMIALRMNRLMATATVCILCIAIAQTVSAADVDARLSSRQAYVDVPVLLQVIVANASDFNEPTMPAIDGCLVTSAGPPAESSQITIINGRRSERRSAVYQYRVTPTREGQFEIPAIEIRADGKTLSTKTISFAAARSVTGDLLFVELEGNKQEVFVGEPLELTLKIWIKPFVDKERRLTLSEGDMWSMVSDQTDWGSFTEKMKELATNRQRPGGRKVDRGDDTGEKSTYYLYQLPTTFYPKKPGIQDTETLKVIVDYPVALGKVRSPLGGMFGDADADSLFPGSAPYGDQLTVTQTRPIVGEVASRNTQVLPVPTLGRPSNYRGAVGRYRIVASATPTTVNAGDPITLNIGIVGTGPMNVLQAPPLADSKSLVAGFRVADESLAGFVQDDTKFFTTTIRPLSQAVKAIPPIEFSFFDPESKSFQTVQSEPIAITVNRAETLPMDAIVGAASSSGDAASTSVAPNVIDPRIRLSLDASPSVLVSQSEPSNQAWWATMILPPMIWLAIAVGQFVKRLTTGVRQRRKALQCCIATLAMETQPSAMTAAMEAFILLRLPSVDGDLPATGRLRVTGLYELANEFDSVTQGFSAPPTDDQRPAAIALMTKIDAAITTKRNHPIKTSASTSSTLSTTWVSPGSMRRAVAKSWLIIAMLGIMPMASADEAIALSLSPSQAKTLLDEAVQAYDEGLRSLPTDEADAKQSFDSASSKLQLLVDAGIENSSLYTNLGTAYFQSGQLGLALSYFDRASRLDPWNDDIAERKKLATSTREQTSRSGSEATTTGVATTVLADARQLIPRRILWIAMTIASVSFWSILIARCFAIRHATWRLALAPLVVIVVSSAGLYVAERPFISPSNAYFINDAITVRAGDGSSFPEVASLIKQDGLGVDVLATRGEWAQVRVQGGQTGWVTAEDVSRIDD